MKQIKFWSILLLTVMMMPLVASCGGDDGDDGGNTGNPLVGTWWVEKTSKGYVKYSEITYNADFTCTWREYKQDRTTLTDSDTGKYKIEGNKLLIWWNSDTTPDEPWTTTFTISGNKMTTTEGGGTTWTKK